MFVVTVDNDIFTYFFTLEKATEYAEKQANNKTVHDHGTVCFSTRPRVVIHKLKEDIEYTSDYLMLDQYAVKIYNDH